MGVFSWKKLKIKTESCEGRWAQVSIRPPLLPGSLGVGLGSQGVWDPACLGRPLTCWGGGLGLPLLSCSCLRARPEVALVSSEHLRAEGACSYPPSSFLCLHIFSVPMSVSCVCLQVHVSQYMYISDRMSPHVCLNESVSTAPPRTRRFLILHLSFTTCICGCACF